MTELTSLKKFLLAGMLSVGLCGCGVMDGLASKLFMSKNPETDRQEHETQRLGHTQDKIVEAQTPEQVQGIVDTHNKTSSRSHPSFWSNAVSALYTAEGRRIAGEVTAFAGMLGVMVWKILSAGTGWRVVDNLIGSTQKIINRNPADAEQYLVLLKQEQERAGVRKVIRRRLGKMRKSAVINV